MLHSLPLLPMLLLASGVAGTTSSLLGGGAGDDTEPLPDTGDAFLDTLLRVSMNLGSQVSQCVCGATALFVYVQCLPL
jgi:hypothetical protein